MQKQEQLQQQQQELEQLQLQLKELECKQQHQETNQELQQHQETKQELQQQLEQQQYQEMKQQLQKHQQQLEQHHQQQQQQLHQQHPQVIAITPSHAGQQTTAAKEGGILRRIFKENACGCAGYPVVSLGVFGSAALCLGIILCAVDSNMLAIGLIFAAAGAVMIIFCCRMCDVPDQDYNTLHSDQPKRLVSSGDVRLQFHNETSSSGCRSSTGSQIVNYPAVTEDGVGSSEQSKGGYLDSSEQYLEPPRQYLNSSGQYQESPKKQLNGIMIPSEEERLGYRERNGRMPSGNSASLDNTNPSYPLPSGGSSPSYSVPLGGLPTNYSIQVAGTPPTYSMLPGGLPMSYCYSLPPGGPTTCYSLPPGGPILNYSSPGEANFPMSPNGAISGFPVSLGRSIPDYLRPSGDSIDSYIPSAPNQISSDIPPPYTVTPFK